MKLGEVGEARVRGYVLVLGQSLRAVLSRDAVREVVRLRIDR